MSPCRIPSGGSAVWLIALGVFVSCVPPMFAQHWRPRTKAPVLANRFEPAGMRRPAWMRALVDEVEPNDSAPDATPAAPGDTVSGAIDPAWDIDFFSLPLTAGTVLDVDVDAFRFGSALDPVIGLFDVDGVTVIAVNDDAGDLDSRLVFTIPETGTYYVAIVDVGPGGGPDYWYTMRFEERPVTETEPNDTPAQAQAVAVDDSVLAVINGSADVDVFVVDVPAEVRFEANLVPFAPSFVADVRLLAADGTTLLDSTGGSTVRPVGVRTFTGSAGPLYVAVRDGAGGTGGIYAVAFVTVAPGPGDPTRVHATGLGFPGGLAAGADGALYVRDVTPSVVRRVAPDGNVTTLATSLGQAAGIAVDAFGDVLTAGVGSLTAVWRIRPTGEIDTFTTAVERPRAMTVGPDGDVWVVDCPATDCPELLRFTPTGGFRERVALGSSCSLGVSIAFSPDSVLHCTDVSGVVYRISEAGAIERVLTVEPGIDAIAFDRDGYLYVGNGAAGTITLYDPTYAAVQEPFALSNLGGMLRLAFGRDADGAMAARLFATNYGLDPADPRVGSIVEVNPDGVRAPGLRIGRDLFRFMVPTQDTAFVGIEYASVLRVTTGSTAGISWEVVSGDLPPGLALDPATGRLSGIPERLGTFVFTVRAEQPPVFGEATFTVLVQEPQIATTAVVDALFGVIGSLTPEEERFLDRTGNNNGRLDVGDVRAFLRSQGLLPEAARVRAAARGSR